MRLLLVTITLISLSFKVIAADKDSIIHFSVHDSVKAMNVVADVNFSAVGKKETYAGIGTKFVKISMERDKGKGEVSFEFPSSAPIVATGLHTKFEKGEVEWAFDWKLNTPYKLMISSAADSAERFVICSGYLYLPEEKKWKLIGTARINNEQLPLQELKGFKSTGKKKQADVTFDNVMIQRAAGPWRNINDLSRNLPSPPVFVNIDSVQQFQADKKIIEDAIVAGKSNTNKNIEGVYYHIIDPGKGKSFTVNDSITAKYQLRIFGTTEVISGSATESYTFKLGSLIKAWQLAVPLVKTGGKIKLVIPSGLAYSIRTRGSKIPPNSILEFDVEVLDAKPGQ